MKSRQLPGTGGWALSALEKGSLIHMVGIGGSGVSGLALILSRMGFAVEGSDLKESAVTDSLKKAGIRIFLSHDATNVAPQARLLVYSSAANLKTNPEILEARKRAIPVLRRGSLLAQISKLKRSVTVSGTHGKTTTSSMTGWILEKAGLKPTVIVGGEIRNIQTNAFLGQSDLFVLETDESDSSFLETSPWIAVVTNVDSDHLEHYGSLEKLIAAFRSHLFCVAADGWAVLCQDDPALAAKIIPHVKTRLKTYGIRGRPDCQAVHLVKKDLGYAYDLQWQGKKAARIELAVPGLHNVLNSLAAAAAARLAGASWSAIARALKEYKGIRRRLEVLGRHGGVLFLDDYGHHPTEIAATLTAAREFYAKGRLLACFQPHRYSRTKELHPDFGPAFESADFVWVCPIYAASEKPIPGVSEDLVLESLKKAGVAAEKFPGRALEIKKQLKPGDTFITVGAGDIWKIGEDLIRRLAD
ncbi:MAG: UDP-N-acetylmuramate--L-alanine ligase [Elusimicrobia bacterium]|nr:UDP-N-acetylmuramate--L-alanine ligase [Elusimicrobiota bacterium]